jgi:hypothetical protein
VKEPLMNRETVGPPTLDALTDSPSAVREFGLLADAQRPLPRGARKFISSVLTVGQQYPGWADLLDR